MLRRALVSTFSLGDRHLLAVEVVDGGGCFTGQLFYVLRVLLQVSHVESHLCQFLELSLLRHVNDRIAVLPLNQERVLLRV